MSKPYEDPHPEPWEEFGVFEAEIRYRFRCFDDEPWFKPMVLAYCRERGGSEFGGEEILRGLEETAKLRGIGIRPRECNHCEEPRDEVTADAPTCIHCLRKDLEEKYDREQDRLSEAERRARLSPEEREREDARNAEAIRRLQHGLMTRDVQ